jgi:hypothetical protein
MHKGEIDELGPISTKFISIRTTRMHNTGALSSTIHGYSSSLHSWDGKNPHTVCSCQGQENVVQCATHLLAGQLDPKKKKLNNDVFALYLTKIQNKLAYMWRIPTETVQEFAQIVNFQALRHSMWLQEKMDPTKEWLQLKYYMTMQDIHMEVQEWFEEWRIPTIPKTVLGGQTRTQDRTVPAYRHAQTMQEKRKILHKAKKGETIPYRRKPRQRRNYSVVLHRDYHAWRRQQEERQNKCTEEIKMEAQ